MSAIWHSRGPIASLLLPLALLFSLLVRLRRRLYRVGFLPSVRLPVPVIVIGNITVGGSGKTPLTLWLAQALAARGRRPGIVLRGYGGTSEGECRVRANDDASRVGDEALLLAQRATCPVFIGRDRAAAAQALLAAHPDCDVILSDDGLQHYRLVRDIEVAVVDRRMVMNGWMLPAGPLREGVTRLAEVAALVRNGEAAVSVHGVPSFDMQLLGARFVRIDDAAKVCSVADLQGRRLHAVAGIGEPARFFDHLAALGLQVEVHAFPDHYAFAPADLDFDGDAILTTEKDAVKLRRLTGLRLPMWSLPVDAVVEPDLAAFVLEKLDGLPPA